MEVKVGVQFAARELVVETDESAEDIQQALESVLEKGGVFTLTDSKGRRIMVPVDKLAYVEVEKGVERAVGFGRAIS